ncbi:MAG: hypothetical protein ACTHQQ_20525 [Solirubrobacteraceae bacterium]
MSFPIAHHLPTAPAQDAGGVSTPVARRDRVGDPLFAPRLKPGVRHRVRLAWVATWGAALLDRELAAGTIPLKGSALALRGRRVTSRRGRKRVADGLVRASRAAERATPGVSAAIPPDQREVLAAGTVLAAIDRRLRAPDPVTPTGMAQLLLLLTEGDSPLYQRSEPGAFGSRLRAAAAALEPADRCARPPVKLDAHEAVRG